MGGRWGTRAWIAAGLSRGRWEGMRWFGGALWGALSTAAYASDVAECPATQAALSPLLRWHGADQAIGMWLGLLGGGLVAAAWYGRRCWHRRAGSASAPQQQDGRWQQENQQLRQQLTSLQTAQGRMASALRETRQLLTPGGVMLAGVTDCQGGETADSVPMATWLQQRGQARLLGILDQLIPLAMAPTLSLPESEALILQSWLLPRLDLLREEALAAEVTWHLQMLPDAALSIDSRLLDETLHTLVRTAIRRAQPGGAVQCHCQLQAEPDGLSLQLQYRCPPGAGPVPEPAADQLILELLQQRWLAQSGRWQSVTSAPGEGGWRLLLPCRWTALDSLLPVEMPSVALSPEDAPALLLVEPDPDLQQLLVSWLTPGYRVSVCASLRGGLLAAREQAPALVLCEQQLPDGDGYTLLESLKSRAETSHIPVVICGSSQETVHLRRAWHHRADDFISKPFEPGVLRLRLQALLENRRMLREWLSSQLSAPTARWQLPASQESDSQVLSRQEQQFGERLRHSTAQRLQRDQASVEQLAVEFGMSTRSLQRKLRALYGMSYSDYVRTLQLQLVVTTLQGGGSIKEAARLAGFKEQSYLTRVFKQQFGMTPSQYKKQHSAEASSPAEEDAVLTEASQFGE